MATHPTLEKQPNPFALPPETHARFVLLVIAALSLTFLSGVVIAFALGLAQATPETISPIPQSTDAGFLADTKTLSLANASFHLRRIALPLVMIFVVLLVTIIRYYRHPKRVRQQTELEPLNADKGQALEREVRRLAAMIGLDPVPNVVSNPSPRSQEAQAFGLPKRYVLRLDGRLRLLLLKMPAAFRALLLHEMGHIVNGDVRRYYFTEALWHATRFYALIPMAAVLSCLLLQAFGERLLHINNDWLSFFTRNLPTYLTVGLQLGGVWLISKAVRASVIRVREYYADAHATLWGAEQGLRMILLSKNPTPSLWERIQGQWRLHPTPAERLATVDDPGRLFKFALDLPFLVGFLLAIVFFGAFSLFSDLTAGVFSGLMAGVSGVMEMAEANPSYVLLALAFGLLIVLVVVAAIILFIPILAISYLMSNVLGLQLMRETLYDQATGQVRPGRFRRLGFITMLWLLGLELGFFILPVYSHLSPFVSVLPQGGVGRIFLLTVWWICAVALIWLWLLFAHQIGSRWLGRYSGSTRPRWRLRIIMTVTSGVLWLFLIPLAAGRMLILFGSASDAGPWLVVLLLSLAAGLLLYAVLWAVTWLLTTRRRIRCSTCRQLTSLNNALGRGCPHCGSALTPWLLAKQATTHRPHPTSMGKQLPVSQKTKSLEFSPAELAKLPDDL